MTTGSEQDESGPTTIQGPVYLDASAWVKLYQAERHSARLNQALLGRRDIFVSDLGATEVASALGQACREGRLDRVSARRLHRKLKADVAAGVMQRLDLTPGVHAAADRLLLAEGDTPLRAADALHVALASQADVATMVTYDPRLAAAARATGLEAAAPGDA